MRKTITLFYSFIFMYTCSLAGNVPAWRSLSVYAGKDIESIRSIQSSLSIEEQELTREARRLSGDSGFFTIYQADESYFLQMECQLNYWKWENNEWINQLDREVIGDYCGMHLIFKDNLILGLSGYGFWENNADLFLLNDPSGQPKFLNTDNQPMAYHSSAISRLESGVLFLLGAEFNKRISSSRKNRLGSYLDLDQLVWKDISYEWKEKKWKEIFSEQQFSAFNGFDLSDYSVFFFGIKGTSNLGVMVLDKNTLNLHVIEEPLFDVLAFSGHLIGDRNQLIFLQGQGREPVRYDVEQQLLQAKLIGKVRIEEPSPLANLVSNRWVVTFALLLILILLRWKWRPFLDSKTPKSKSVPEVSSLLMESELAEFGSYRGQLLHQAQMDQLLGLEDHLSFDLRKVQRAKKIRTLNSYHESRYGISLIKRERDPKDRRMINYRIASIPDSDHLFSAEQSLVNQ